MQSFRLVIVSTVSVVLEYSEYRHFKPVIDRAKDACRNSGYQVADHFEDILGMVSIGSKESSPHDIKQLSKIYWDAYGEQIEAAKTVSAKVIYEKYRQVKEALTIIKGNEEEIWDCLT